MTRRTSLDSFYGPNLDDEIIKKFDMIVAPVKGYSSDGVLAISCHSKEVVRAFPHCSSRQLGVLIGAYARLRKDTFDIQISRVREARYLFSRKVS